MKPILKSKAKTLVSLKLVTILVILVATISFVLSVKFVNQIHKEYNQLIIDIQLPAPTCLTIGGFYTSPIEIKLETTQLNSKIYFTTDGSEPSLKSPVYIKPIIIADRTTELNNLSNIPSSPRWKPPLGDVFKGTVVRAISVINETNKSMEFTRTYFVTEKGSKRYTFPVIAITVNPEDLFGYEKGIYVLGKNYDDKNDYVKKNTQLELPWWKYPSNYLKRGSNSERKAYIEFYETSNTLAFQSNVGIRINGNATRGFAQKSLRINFGISNGMETLNYKLFAKNKTNDYKSFILRNSGNDWDKTMFRDAFMQSLMVDSKMEIQDNRPVIVFINGEYWGIHNACERFDENFLSTKYKLNKDSIAILEMDGFIFYGKKEDSNSFKELLDFISKNDLKIYKNYLKVNKQIDIDNFIDFVITNVYYCNSDWPNNNVKYWRYKSKCEGIDSLGIKDGRWRWMLYDTDYGFGNTGINDYQMDLLEKTKSTLSIGIIFSGLLENPDFKNKFISRFQYHLNNTFDKERVLKKIKDFEIAFAPEMEENINRWRVIGSLANWKENVQELNDFATKRPAIQAEQLNQFLNLKGANRISIKN